MLLTSSCLNTYLFYFRETEKRKELVREVEMGPFKHEVIKFLYEAAGQGHYYNK